MQSQSPLGRRKGLPLRALPSSPSASGVTPPAAQSITFPLRPPRSPQARGPEAERTEGQKQRQARSAASPANGTATRGWFRAGGFRTPLRAAQTQPQTLRRTLFQKLPSLTLSGFTLYLPIRQQQSTKDAALGLLNRQAREQSVPLLQQEDLIPRAQKHARSRHPLVRSLCAENSNLRSLLAFLQHPVVSLAGKKEEGGSSSQNNESTRVSSLETALRDAQKKVERLEVEKKQSDEQYKRSIDEMARQNAALQTKLAELVSIPAPSFKLWITGTYNLDCYVPVICTPMKYTVMLCVFEGERCAGGGDAAPSTLRPPPPPPSTLHCLHPP